MLKETKFHTGNI